MLALLKACNGTSIFKETQTFVKSLNTVHFLILLLIRFNNMSRHRNLKQMVDDDDEYDDFDPMDDDESSEDYYITQVINKYKKLPRDKIIKALDDTDWDIDGAIKLLKSRDQPVKPGKQPVSGKSAQTGQVTKSGAGPALTGTTSVSSSQSGKQTASSKPSLSASSSVSQSSSIDTSKKIPEADTNKKQEDLRKLEESKTTHTRLNQTYPDVHPST